MKKEYPQFVKFINARSTLRLKKDCNGYEYYVDGGCWGVEFITKDGKIISKSYMDSINNIELIPITEKEWRNAQLNYAPDNPPIYGYLVEESDNSQNELKYLLIKRK